MDTSYVFVTGTEIQLVAPGQAPTTGVYRVPFSITTPGGQSAPVSAAYAGIPKVTSVVNTANSRNLDGTYGARDTGGAPIRVTGRGFAGQLIGPVEFNGVGTAYSNGTQYTFTVHGSTSLITQTVSQNPALVERSALHRDRLQRERAAKSPVRLSAGQPEGHLSVAEVGTGQGRHEGDRPRPEPRLHPAGVLRQGQGQVFRADTDLLVLRLDRRA